MQVIEQYVSCRPGLKVNGRIYAMEEVIPDAGSLSTLPALLRTNRIRLKAAYVADDPAQDIGSAQSSKVPLESTPAIDITPSASVTAFVTKKKTAKKKARKVKR